MSRNKRPLRIDQQDDNEMEMSGDGMRTEAQGREEMSETSEVLEMGMAEDGMSFMI